MIFIIFNTEKNNRITSEPIKYGKWRSDFLTSDIHIMCKTQTFGISILFR